MIEPLLENYISNYKEKTILITGGAGFIGSSIIKKLCKVDCNIILFRKKNSAKKNISEQVARISVVEGDIRDTNIWEKLLKNVDIIFHFAAQTSSMVANKHPVLDAEINLLPIIRLIETCQKINVSPHVVFSGTVTQVGLTEKLPVNETFKDEPVTVYDISKLSAEKYLQFFSSQLGNYAVTLRLSNVYGPGSGSGSSDRGILNIMIRKALSGEPLTIYGDGNFTRDYIYIDDITNAFLLAGSNIKALNGKYFILGSGVGHTIKEMVFMIRDEVAKRTDRKVDVAHVVLPENLSKIELRDFIADISQFSSITGWKPIVSLKDGINHTINSLLKEGVS